MIEHECVIGLLHHCDYSELVTLEELEDHIIDNVTYNIFLMADPVLKDCKELYRKEWSIKDYADKRRHTNLTRFDYCPECGKRIEWKRIRSCE